ncbi:hypothetical protein AAG570_013375 [Ranatra chinensis]|uniref:Gustatory receptor n=1 Tax=Ranatra chinensis TaxID=642074 RepID=A0ABD0YC97_9HEMI
MKSEGRPFLEFFLLKDVRTFLRRAMLVSRFVPVFPMDSEFRPSRAEALKSSSVMALFGICYFSSLYWLLEFDRFFRNEYNRKIQAAELVLLGTCIVLCFVFYLKNGKLYCRTVEAMRGVDAELTRKGEAVSYNCLPVVLSNCCLLLFVVLLLTPLIWGWMSSCDSSGVVADMIITVVTVIFSNCLACPISSCLTLLNSQFGHARRVLVSMKNSASPLLIGVEDVERVEGLMQVHGMLCDIAYELNAAMGLQLLIMAFYIDVVVITTLYLIFTTLLTTPDACSVFSLVCNSFWVVQWVYQLFYIVFLSTSTVKQENLLLHITMRREAHFSASGLFPVDYSLIHSMAASATTYLVILIQFDQGTAT